ncbi:transcriptional regulator [Morganella morganii]|uniref:helix-turn-helix domain-containing protein n=1 Tax=Morganella morganii TaxID=582 RepID=UPI0021CF5492|nr:transcriptional regulator [Morganella morganii]MCU6236795.1 transcriptional regulator [Morganella morganii]
MNTIIQKNAIAAMNSVMQSIPFLGGDSSEQAYREALGFVEYLIENDESSPLIDLLTIKIQDYENAGEKFTAFQKEVDDIPTGVAALKVLMEQHGLKYTDLLNEIGSKSLVSLIMSGKRMLTVGHIKALSARFHVKPELFFS